MTFRQFYIISMLTLCTRVRLYAKKLFTYAPVTLSPNPTMAPPQKGVLQWFCTERKGGNKVSLPNQNCWNCKYCFVWMRDLSFFSRLYVPPNKKAGPNLAPLLKLVYNRHCCLAMQLTSGRWVPGTKLGENLPWYCILGPQIGRCHSQMLCWVPLAVFPLNHLISHPQGELLVITSPSPPNRFYRKHVNFQLPLLR